MATVKKTTKVQTPVDERETFVSLQKNFANSEQGVQEKLKTLYSLQITDNEITKLVQERGELPKEVEQLEGEVETFKAKYARTEQVIEGYKQTIENAKKEIEDTDAEIEKYTKLLAEGISNSREYDSLDKELENLKLLRQISEKHINEALDTIAERESDLERIQDRIDVREEDLLVKREELEHIVESTSSQEEQLLARKAELTALLDERTLSAYERIRKSTHNNLAVVSLYPPVSMETTKEGLVPIYGDSCGGCFQAITPQRINDVLAGNKLVICEHCGRIIVNPDI